MSPEDDSDVREDPEQAAFLRLAAYFRAADREGIEEVMISQISSPDVAP